MFRFIRLIPLALAVCALPMLAAQTPQAAPDAATQPSASTPAIAASDQPTREQLDKLFEVMRLRAQLQNVMRSIPEMAKQQTHAQMQAMLGKMPQSKQLTSDQQAQFDKLMDKFTQRALSIYPVDEMLDDLALLYQHHLSRTDVDAFITFYQSPAGQHLLDAQPAIMQEYMPTVMQRVNERSVKLTAEMVDDLKALFPPPPAKPAVHKQAAQ